MFKEDDVSAVNTKVDALLRESNASRGHRSS